MAHRQADKRVVNWDASLTAIDQYRKKGQFRLALPLANRVVRLARTTAEQADAYAAKGLVERGLERYGAAAAWLDKSRRKYLSLGDIQGEAYVLWGLGGCERFRGRPEKAVRYFRESQKKFLTAGDRHGWTYATYGLAGALRVMGQPRESLRQYQAAWRRCVRHRDRFGIAYGLCGMAHGYRRLSAVSSQRSGKNYIRKAERCYRTSGVLYRNIGDWSSVGYTSWGLGQVAKVLRPRAAPGLFRRAMREFQQAGDSRGIALSKMALARLGEGSMPSVIHWASRHGISLSTLNSY